jgi:Domain of unknown function (DU1801)
MVQSSATTVAAYLESLPEDRRAIIASVRALVNAHLPAGYDETMRFGMISWEVPLGRYPDTYNRQPLVAVALAAQKRHTSLYLSCVPIAAGAEAALRDAYAAAGLRLDMGTSCLRFRSLGELLPEAVIPVLEQASVDAFIATYEAGRSSPTP